MDLVLGYLKKTPLIHIDVREYFLNYKNQVVKYEFLNANTFFVV